MTPDERRWHEDRKRNGWTLPKKAWWIFRCWGFRHVRLFWHACWAEWNAAQWARAGIGLGQVEAYDRWVLYAIAQGKC